MHAHAVDVEQKKLISFTPRQTCIAVAGVIGRPALADGAVPALDHANARNVGARRFGSVHGAHVAERQHRRVSALCAFSNNHKRLLTKFSVDERIFNDARRRNAPASMISRTRRCRNADASRQASLW